MDRLFENNSELMAWSAYLAGFAISQPCSCFFNNLIAFRSETNSRSKFVVSNDRGLGMASTFYWKTYYITEKVGKNFDLGRVEVWRGRLMIKAVATFEIADINCKNEGIEGYQNVLRMDIDSGRSNPPVVEQESSSEDSKDVSEREKLRRMRISKANKGKNPWNKGRKHSPGNMVPSILEIFEVVSWCFFELFDKPIYVLNVYRNITAD